MRKKNFLVFLFFLFSISLFTLWGKIQSHSKESLSTLPNENLNLLKEDTYKIASIEEKDVLTQKKQVDKIPSYNIEMYQNISIEEAKLYYAPRPMILPIMAVRIKRKNIMIKDRLQLDNIEGLDYMFTVSYIHSNTDGSQSITARYSDEAIPYTLTMTQSSSDTYITFATPEGSYEIEAYKGIGYVYKTQDIRQYLAPNPKDDMLILNLSDTIK